MVSGCSFTAADFGDRACYWQTLVQCYDRLRDVSWPDLNEPRDWTNLATEIQIECEIRGMDWRHLTYVTWPVYLRDLLGVQSVVDTSASGAGNRHIHDSVILAVEQAPMLDPTRTLAVVMWSGWDRDDFLGSHTALSPGRADAYRYTNDTVCISTRGMLGDSNSVVNLDAVKKIKDEKSRALENFTLVVGLRKYLESRGITAIFTQHSSQLQEQSFDITQYLPDGLVDVWQQQFDIWYRLGDMAQDTIDGSHPTPKWHRVWTQSVLLPYLISKGIA